MIYDAKKHHRRSIRLKEYDYSQNGFYFVTICTKDRRCIFDNEQIRDAVDRCWTAIPEHFPNVKLDEYVIMPNHIHGIIIICRDGACPVHEHATYIDKACRVPTLGTIIGSFKSASTRIVNKITIFPDKTLWQSRFYDHIIRNDEDLNEIRQYIRDNPIKWELDENNPNNLYDLS